MKAVLLAGLVACASADRDDVHPAPPVAAPIAPVVVAPAPAAPPKPVEPPSCVNDGKPYDRDTLRERVSALYRAVGLPDADAALVADTLVRADLWGHSSHGVLRAPWYLERVRKGVMKPVTRAARVLGSARVRPKDGIRRCRAAPSCCCSSPWDLAFLQPGRSRC